MLERLLQSVGGVVDRADQLLFPRDCLACDAPRPRRAEVAGLCESCVAQLPWRGRESAPETAPLEIGKRRFAAVVVAMRYQPPIDELVLRLKYGGVELAARPLAEMLARAIAAASLRERPELLVAVPMHPLKRWLRGGDHAQRLAEELGIRLRLPVAAALVRGRATHAQGGARSLRERIAQVRAAFRARGHRIVGAHVGLVDDVVTSGATAAAAAKALRRGGARAVTLLAVAGNG
ncbi:MAG: ComF family protein [Planctomycetes bacterium]|nr:ComF family protein [Planctomycetota bacterium]